MAPRTTIKTDTAKRNALFLKLRKGADASLSINQLFEVLDVLGGWKVETIVGLVQMHEDDDTVGIAERDEDYAKSLYLHVLDHQVDSLPEHPVSGCDYYKDVEDFHSWDVNWGGDTNHKFHGARYKHWVGREGYRLTSPEGAVFELLPHKYDKPESTRKNLRVYEVLRWLKKETNYLRQISDALGMVTYEEEKAGNKPRTRDNTGSCPCCFGNFKLRDIGKEHPVTVLHGFQRPGIGYVVGQCFGVKYPPFELSPQGTKDFIEFLKKIKANQEGYLALLQAGKITKIASTRIGGADHTPETDGEFQWAELVKREIVITERKISLIEKDIAAYQKLVDEWKPRALPKEGDLPTTWLI